MSESDTDTTKAFYFAAKGRRLQHGDGRQIIVGETHSVYGPVKLCERGLHASQRLIDALRYAPGPILYRVELSGDIRHGSDKMVATHRRYLAEFDAGDLLRRFACDQALINIELIKPYCLEEDYNTIIGYLETGDEDLRKRAYNVSGISLRSSYSAYLARLSAQYAVSSYAPWMTMHNAMLSTIELQCERGEAGAGDYDSLNEEANGKLTAMVREAAGWEI